MLPAAIAATMEDVMSPDSCIPPERELSWRREGMQQPGLLHSCVPVAQAKKWAVLGPPQRKLGRFLGLQRNGVYASDSSEQAQANDVAGRPRYGRPGNRIACFGNRSPWTAGKSRDGGKADQMPWGPLLTGGNDERL